MGVGGDMFRGLFFAAVVGFIVMALAVCSAAVFVLWLLYRGIASFFT